MNNIDILKKIKNIDNLELVASNIKMQDGSTVEDSIASLQEELGGQISRAKDILTNLSSKVE